MLVYTLCLYYFRFLGSKQHQVQANSFVEITLYALYTSW